MISRSIFQDDQFNAVQLVADRRNLLDPGDLQELLGEIKSDLSNLINQKYLAFIHVPKSLLPAYLGARSTLHGCAHIREQLEKPVIELESLAKNLEMSLQRRTLLRTQKASVQLLLNIVSAFKSVEKMMETLNDLDMGQLERIVPEFCQLTFLASQGPNVQLIKNIQPVSFYVLIFLENGGNVRLFILHDYFHLDEKYC
jgi:hypothetical protein